MTTRRRFLASSAAPFVARAAAARPNVLFIAVDDLRPQLGCYGRGEIHSPHIDRLAARGLRFDGAYCQQAVCAPSRMSLLTGLRPDSTGVYDLQTPLSKARPDALSLPRHLRENGYATVTLGKIYHHQGDDAAAWSAPDWRPEASWVGRAYRDPESARLVREYDARVTAEYEAAVKAGGKAAKPRLGMGPAYEHPAVADNAYHDGMVADRALEELGRLKGKPFFLAAGFVKPHLPFNAPKKYWDLYDRRSIPLSTHPDWPLGAPEIARMDWGELRAYEGIPKGGPVSEELARTLIHGYYACVSYMDAQVGRLLDGLESLGLRENTIVILWGDHGWKLSDYGAWCKHTNFEIDVHVPMILSVPDGRAAGRGTPALVEYVDIFPTLAELCGVPVPAHCEGLSMAPLLDRPGRPWKRAAFSQYPRQGDSMGYSLRSGRYRYTEWIRRGTGEVIARELYDHSAGRLAARNIADEPRHAETMRELSLLLDKGRGWRRVREGVARS